MVARKARKRLIEEREVNRGSTVLVYFTGDRRPVTSQIAEDAVRPSLSTSSRVRGSVMFRPRAAPIVGTEEDKLAQLIEKVKLARSRAEAIAMAHPTIQASPE